MTENHVDPAVIKKTQDTLGKCIKKPVLTEKLLKRPPFRFIHDIIISIIKETGYFNGLFTKDELNSENIKDRDGKMQFLQKLIDVIKIGLNEDLSIRASKIVAGHEAEKTNEFLQKIGKIIEQKIDLTKAIDTIKTGKQTKSKSKVKEVNEKKTKPSSEIKNEKKDKEKIKDKNEKEKVKKSLNEKDVQKISEKKKIGEKDLKTNVKTKTKDTSSGDKQKPIKRTSSIDKTVVNKESKLSKKKNEDKKSKPSQDNVLTENVKKIKTINSQEIEKNLEPAKQELIENVPVKENETIQKERRKSSNSSSTEINAILLKAQNQQVSDEKSLQSDSRKSSASKNHTKQKSANKEKNSEMVESHNDRKLSANQDSITITNEPNSFSRDDISSKTNSQDDQKSPNISSDAIETKSELKSPIDSQLSSTNQNQKKKSKPIKPLEKDLKRQSTFVRENTNDELKIRPKTSLRPPSVRPASARPGAPRRRDKNVEIVLEPNDQVKMAGINVKLENFNAELEDDGENLVIIENSDNQNDLKLDNNEKNIEIIDENSQQGHLVQQILETQKELIQTSGVEINSEADLLDIGTLQKRQSSAKQMDSLRDIIQNLTRSVNPLGKLMDFIPEDIDSMQLELTMWRDAYLQAANELKKERMQTESSIEPMKNQLEQLDTNIKEYTEMINAIRARILANSQKISSLLLEQ